jgi:hypothetical protein
MAEGVSAKLKGVRLYSKDSNFRLAPIRQDEAGRYYVDVKPLSTTEVQTEAGEIVFEIKGQGERKRIFYVRIAKD